jgi:hypothetical protein
VLVSIGAGYRLRRSLVSGPSGRRCRRREGEAAEDAGTSALLLESYPIRDWDHEVGLRQTRRLRLDVAGCGKLEDLTGPVGIAIHQEALALTPEGGTLITKCFEAEISAMIEADLVGIGPGRPPDPGFGW